jgi:hypothetical protein
MTTSATHGRRAPGRVLKSPLAAPGASTVASPDALGSAALALGRAALTADGLSRWLHARAASPERGLN